MHAERFRDRVDVVAERHQGRQVATGQNCDLLRHDLCYGNGLMSIRSKRVTLSALVQSATLPACVMALSVTV